MVLGVVEELQVLRGFWRGEVVVLTLDVEVEFWGECE